MTATAKFILGCATCAAAFPITTAVAQAIFPPAPMFSEKVGDILTTASGTQRVVVGFFGAQSTVTLDHSRPLYYGPVGTAQFYARKTGIVWMVTADRLPKQEDHAAARYYDSGPQPLSPEFLQSAKVQLESPQKITDSTDAVTLGGAVSRSPFCMPKTSGAPPEDK